MPQIRYTRLPNFNGDFNERRNDLLDRGKTYRNSVGRNQLYAKTRTARPLIRRNKKKRSDFRPVNTRHNYYRTRHGRYMGDNRNRAGVVTTAGERKTERDINFFYEKPPTR